MSQKSILSFFKPPNKPVTENETSDKNNESLSMDVASVKTPAEKTPSKQTTKKTPAKQAAKKTPAKETAKKTSAKETAKKTPAKETAKKTPAKETAKKTPAKQTAEKTPAKQTAKKTPARKTAKKTPDRKIGKEESAENIPEKSPVKELLSKSPLKKEKQLENGEEVNTKGNLNGDVENKSPEKTESDKDEDMTVEVPKRITAKKQTKKKSPNSSNARPEVNGDLNNLESSDEICPKNSGNITPENSDSKKKGKGSSKKRKASPDSNNDDSSKQSNTSGEKSQSRKRKKGSSEVENKSPGGKKKDTERELEMRSEDTKDSAADESPIKKGKVSKKNSRASNRISSSDEEEDEIRNEPKQEECKQTTSEEPNKEKENKLPVHSFFAPKKKETGSSPETHKTESKSKIGKSETGEEIYNPEKSSYHPVNDACWKKGEKVPYLALARTLEEIEKISARLKMIEILANFLRSVIALTPEDLLHCLYLCLNRIAPEYEGVEMGVGETLLMKAVAQATGRAVDKIKEDVTVKGDLGLVAESSRGNQRVMFAFPKLTVTSVFAKFKEIAQMSGNASMSKKVDKMQALFAACRHCEARYIVRSLRGKLRIGLAEQSILSALAQAAVLTPPNQPEVLNAASKMSSDAFKKMLEEQTLILKTTYCECPNYDIILKIMLKEGIMELPKHCHIIPGIPLKPMLAHPTKGIDEVLQRFDKNEFTCEFKYDGERAQIHRDDKGVIKIYSRNQEDNTSKYPDIISRLHRAFKPEAKSFILDSEAVAWDRQAKQILPFQILSTRKRKDAADSEITVQVCIMAFDLLYLNGDSLVKKTLKERRDLLRDYFVEVESEFMFASSMDGSSADVMHEFLEESIKGRCEGLMVKALEVDATYEIAKRSHNWLKLKKDYLEGVGDTLDLVVIGAWNGKGKRTNTYGAFLLACYDGETEEFQTICKIGTGFKDDDLEAHTKFFKDHVISGTKSYYRSSGGNLEPDVWFEPVQVWEVKCADLSISPVHKAAIGIVDPEKGISLRFPRFLRIRDDKKVEDATTASQVATMYRSQQQVQNQETKFEDEDFY